MSHTKSLDDELVELRQQVNEAEECDHALNGRYEALNTRIQDLAVERGRVGNRCQALEARLQDGLCAKCWIDIPSNANGGSDLPTSNSSPSIPQLSEPESSLSNQPNTLAHLVSQPMASPKPTSATEGIAQFGKSTQHVNNTRLSSQPSHFGKAVASVTHYRTMSTSPPSEVSAISSSTSARQSRPVVVLGLSGNEHTTVLSEATASSSQQPSIPNTTSAHLNETSGPFTAPPPGSNSLPASSSSRLPSHEDVSAPETMVGYSELAVVSGPVSTAPSPKESQPRGRGPFSSRIPIRTIPAACQRTEDARLGLSMSLRTTGTTPSTVAKRSRRQVSSSKKAVSPQTSGSKESSAQSKIKSRTTSNFSASSAFPGTAPASLSPATHRNDPMEYPGQQFQHTLANDINTSSRPAPLSPNQFNEFGFPLAMRMPPYTYNVASLSTSAGRMVHSPPTLISSHVPETKPSSLRPPIPESTLLLSPGKRVRGADSKDGDNISQKRRKLSSPPVKVKAEEDEDSSIHLNAVAGPSHQDVYRGPVDMNHPPGEIWSDFSENIQSQASNSAHGRNSRSDVLRRQ